MKKKEKKEQNRRRGRMEKKKVTDASSITAFDISRLYDGMITWFHDGKIVWSYAQSSVKKATSSSRSLKENHSFFYDFPESVTDGPTDGRTDRPTDLRTDVWKAPLFETKGRKRIIKKGRERWGEEKERWEDLEGTKQKETKAWSLLSSLHPIPRSTIFVKLVFLNIYMYTCIVSIHDEILGLTDTKWVLHRYLTTEQKLTDVL